MDSLAAQQFEDVSMPHIDALFQTALLLTANRAEAEELVLETYASVKRISQQRLDPTKWRLTLFKVLFQRIQRRNPGWLRPEPQMGNATWSALGQIPTAFREVLLLVDCQDLSYKQAAEILETTVEVVAERLSQGRQLLEAGLSGPCVEVSGQAIVGRGNSGSDYSNPKF